MRPSFIRPHPRGSLLRLKVQPRASANQIGGCLGDELRIKVTAPPVDSAANDAVVDYLAQRLGCPRRSVMLLRGQNSRHKQILIEGISPELIVARLGI